MISRYTLPEMGRIWTDEAKFGKWLEIEIAACEAMADLGQIPQAAVDAIKAKARFEVARILEIEEVTKHDVIAFTTCVAEHVGEESKYIHMGLTSSDVVDTAMTALMKEAATLLRLRLAAMREVVGKRAKEHKYTVEVGRTHGIHAEPVTFGFKLAVWYAELGRAIERMDRAISVISVGKISGAVGTFANIDPKIEAHVCAKLGLDPAPVSTQIIQRDRHAEFMALLAVIAGSMEKFATELRNLQRTDIMEVEEAFTKGQKGSSAMPHKRNPVSLETVVGLARVIRTNALTALENEALWHERDITHSSAERIIVPDSCILMDYIVTRLTGVIENLQVYPENMQANLDKTLGLVFSQRVLLSLVDKGMMRETAYLWVQRNALTAWSTKEMFKDLILRDADIMAHLSANEVEGLFNYDYHLRHIDTIFERVGLA